MDTVYALFLEALRAALRDEKVGWDGQITPEQWRILMGVAQDHHVLPMIFEAVYSCPAAKCVEPELFAAWKRETVMAVMTQTMKTADFLPLYQDLRRRGLKPLVVKGIICRSLYPRPDYRLSGDEDVFVGCHQVKGCHRVLLDHGMEPLAPNLDDYEVPYSREESPLYIELHRTLFPEKCDAYGDLNRFFEAAFDRAVEIQIQGVDVATLSYTDHMLYLICHAFKHFLHSGFGLRQVCDMILFANAYGRNIDWQYVYTKCRTIRADKFAAAIFAIGEKYLVFSPDQAELSEAWRGIRVDPLPLLEDMLTGGIYGKTDLSRVHSSTMTLNAVAAEKKGKKPRRNLLKTVFPPKKDLVGRYPYLRTSALLLPVAWGSRILNYARETAANPDSSAAEVIRTGSRRIELLREYEIIE